MESLAVAQISSGERIRKAFINFKKDGLHRRTAEYISNRLKQLELEWTQFNDRHEEIQQLGDEIKDHAYFREGLYDQVESIYLEYKSALQASDNAKMTEVNQPTPAQSDITQATMALESLQRRIRQQGAAMAAMRQLLASTDADLTASQSLAYFKQGMTMIRENWRMIFERHLEIMGESSTLDYQTESFFLLERQVQQELIKLQERLDDQLPSSPVTAETGGYATTGSINLPKINLPTFNGDYLQWIQFHELYTELIHNQSIPKAQKMFYLMSNISGEARVLIKHLSISDQGYDTAWNILKARYANTRLLVNSVIQRLLSQPSMNMEKAGSIRALHDTTNECMQTLRNLGIPVEQWDAIVVYLILQRLDNNTRTQFEQQLTSPREVPSLKQLLNFLEIRFQALETLSSNKTSSMVSQRENKHTSSHTRSTLLAVERETLCSWCNRPHPLFSCQGFLAQTPTTRFDHVKGKRLCINCLREGHTASTCTARNCKRCAKKHNTLLHREEVVGTTQKQSTPCKGREQASGQSQMNITSSNTTLSLATEDKTSQVLLSTIMVDISDSRNQFRPLRAVLDSGSQLNLITATAANEFGLKKVLSELNIRSVGGTSQQVHQRVNLLLRSRINRFTANMQAYIVPQITIPQPLQGFSTKTWKIPRNIELADTTFNEPGNIDLLIGAEWYYNTLATGQIKLGPGLPILQNTVFGWIVAGKLTNPSLNDVMMQPTCGIYSTDAESLNQSLERFWQLEENEITSRQMTPREAQCESHFHQNTKRTAEGRFEVRLPFLHDSKRLGDSKAMALRRFLHLERKLQRNPDLKARYLNFMQEYQSLGHMSEIKDDQIGMPHYYLPHHCVLKPSSSTTKLRVVFDASAKTTTNISLNEILHTGPTIQDDLFAILLRFRLHRFVFTADIEKMYRQVTLHPADRKYQLILWRNDPSEQLKSYQLNTVTYGTTSAPYLATKCLQQLASQAGEIYPFGSSAVKEDFYMDDLMSGSNTLREAIWKKEEIVKMLSSAGFQLHKWCSNQDQILQDIPKEHTALKLNLEDSAEEQIKTLGIAWLPKQDVFTIEPFHNPASKITKRGALSDIAHIFDPLGFLSPVTIIAKMFIQQLWSLKLDWDAALPMELHSKWVKFKQNLEILNQIKIPRHVFAGKVPKMWQLHAFSDASEKAYGAVVYVRATYQDGPATVRLLCAKSRVAPLKVTTIPRLELCAAKLTAELVKRSRKDLKVADIPCFFWTDSQIVLNWLHAEAASYHTFVANRITAIQECSDASQWRHVNTEHNPADLVSRGISADRLKDCSLWFFGPVFLHRSDESWTDSYVKQDIDLEKKRAKVVLTAVHNSDHFIYRIDHRNSFQRMKRVVGYVLRFVRRARGLESCQSNNLLSVEQLEEASMVIIREVQREEFREEINAIKTSKQLSKGNRLSTLTPFLDERSGLLRVGGRLENANLPYESKHQILLPYKHDITKLIITQIHNDNLHAGPQTLRSLVRQKFWPLNGMTLARSVVQNCVRCAKSKPRLLTQLMGNLPADRVQQARPFLHTGVDFAGPFWTHFKIRGKRPQKTYLAVFCCFSTKACHLELVTDLTTEAFIGALKRFIGRRGHCRKIYCDNATNFVGAKNQLEAINKVVYSDVAQEKISSFCVSKGMDFCFIPPKSPHFGGLWEAAVKSAKQYMLRNLATVAVTYEELETIVIEIEAILNSRPLTPLSSDPNDLSALTPGHFLIGEPLRSIIEVADQRSKPSLSQRWKLVSEMKHQFWQRWSKEYLCELQYRYKWKQRCNNVRIGTMVVIKDDNLPVLKWQLGRIINIFKGTDQLVRVAEVKTTTGTVKRPIHNLAPLPVEDNSASEHTNSSEEVMTSFPPSGKHKIASEPDFALERGEPGPSASSSRPKKPCSSLSAVGLLLWTTLVMPILTLPIQVSPFASSPGIYSEKLGTAHLIVDEWKLVVYYDLRPYWKELDTIKTGLDRLNQICHEVRTDSLCEPTITQFQLLLNEFQRNNEFFLHFGQKHETRKKRGALNIVGNLANSLFGILDSEYAKQMSNVISQVQDNEDHLLQLIKNQTSIIDSTAIIMLQSQEETETRLGGLEYAINQSVAHINSIVREVHSQEATQYFASLAVRLLLTTTSYQRVQSALVDVLIDTHQGKINPLLLTPNQLQAELLVIRENLPTTMRLPFQPLDLATTYRMMKVEGCLLDHRMIFKITLPLASHQRFDLLHLLPVPLLRNGSTVMLVIKASFLIISQHRDEYYPLSEQEMATCTRAGSSNYLCRQLHPLYRRGATIAACELSFITPLALNTTCALKPWTEPPRYISLLRPNHWIYFIPSRTTVALICDNSESQVVLEGSGILQLHEDCALKEETLTIQAHKLYHSSFNTTTVLVRNMTEWRLFNHLNELPTLTKSHESLKKTLQELQHKIQAQRTMETLHPISLQNDVHQFTVGYIGLILIGGLGAYLWWQRRKQPSARGPQENPVPLPRQLPAEAFRLQMDQEVE